MINVYVYVQLVRASSFPGSKVYYTPLVRKANRNTGFKYNVSSPLTPTLVLSLLQNGTCFLIELPCMWHPYCPHSLPVCPADKKASPQHDDTTTMLHWVMVFSW